MGTSIFILMWSLVIEYLHYGYCNAIHSNLMMKDEAIVVHHAVHDIKVQYLIPHPAIIEGSAASLLSCGSVLYIRQEGLSYTFRV